MQCNYFSSNTHACIKSLQHVFGCWQHRPKGGALCMPEHMVHILLHYGGKRLLASHSLLESSQDVSALSSMEGTKGEERHAEQASTLFGTSELESQRITAEQRKKQSTRCKILTGVCVIAPKKTADFCNLWTGIVSSFSQLRLRHSIYFVQYLTITTCYVLCLIFKINVLCLMVSFKLKHKILQSLQTFKYCPFSKLLCLVSSYYNLEVQRGGGGSKFISQW